MKRILVALDIDTDTPTATRYAAEIARRHDAVVTGLAVVDMGTIEHETRGGGIGSMYYADKLRDNLTAEARDRAQELLAEFDATMEREGVEYRDRVEEGVPFERIIEDMKYFDLLVIGREPHFFYSHPQQRTETLVKTVKNIVSPTLVVGDDYQDVQRVLITYDGSDSSARAMRRFVQDKPFGTDIDVEVLHVHKGHADESELMLRLATDYLKAHGFAPTACSKHGSDVDKEIIDHVQRSHKDLIVAGAHSVSRIRQLAFGSTTLALLKNSPAPLYLDS